MNNNEQPGVVGAETQVRPENSKKDRQMSQFEAFESRVKLNLKVPNWRSNILQFFIQNPNFIPGALVRAFDTKILRDLDGARNELEDVIWGCSDKSPIEVKKLVIWVLRQSSGLIEEVVLHSPFDPIQNGYNSPIAEQASDFISTLNCSRVIPFSTILRGIGSPLLLGTGAHEYVWNFHLAYRHHDFRKARRLMWDDAMEDIKTIVPVDRDKLIIP